MVIRGIKQTLPGVYEITPDAGSAFFLRAAYLSIVSTDVLEESVEFQTLIRISNLLSFDVTKSGWCTRRT